ncbi:MAG: hypothetical protein LBU43_13105 [Candidatus Accumulibacter sp.]|jgi:hypothetical protein|nr:hypothetical protein [Accumulibacter sp.]
MIEIIRWIVLTLCATVIFGRVLTIPSEVPNEFLKGHKFRALCFAVHLALLAGGTLAALCGLPIAADFFLASLALIMLADRRNPIRRNPRHSPQRNSHDTPH